MKEKNKHILTEAIQKLPEYEPKDQLWDFIQDDIIHDDSNNRMREALQRLPTYDPPELVWDQIENHLGKSTESGARIVGFSRTRRWLSVAASVAILMVAGWWISANSIESDELAFSVETLDDNLMKQDWNDDEGAFDELMALCKVKMMACEAPEFQKLKSELDELNDAKEALNSAIGKFGTNATLISQIKDLELDRTEIMKAMIEKLI